METVPDSKPAGPPPPETLRGEIERFLESCRRPAIIEAGLDPLPLNEGMFTLSCRGGLLLLEAWDETRTFVRRVNRVEGQRGGRLRLTVQKFGGGTLRLAIVDLEDARAAPALRRNRQESLTQHLATMLARQLPGWRVERLTSGADLEHTLSPAHARAYAVHQQRRMAVLCAPGGGGDESLTFGLLWLDYLRRRVAPSQVQGLVLFVPRGEEDTTRLRIRHLDPEKAHLKLFVYDELGEQEVSLEDTGNLIARLARWQPADVEAAPAAHAWSRQLAREPGVEAVETGGGMLSLRVAGLEFARAEGPRLWLGVGRKRRAKSLAEAVQLARSLAGVRLDADAPFRHALARAHPEARLESLVRGDIPTLDAGLRPDPIYGQVCALTGRDRGIADLLAIDNAGRLAVIELKASEDPHLPLQALDYWIRVRHHAAEGAFGPAGYFPGLTVRPDPPRLLLVGPALRFHPTTETLLGFFPSDMQVERIGLGVEWHRRFRVILRVTGAARPEWPAPPREGHDHPVHTTDPPRYLAFESE